MSSRLDLETTAATSWDVKEAMEAIVLKLEAATEATVTAATRAATYAATYDATDAATDEAINSLLSGIGR